MSPTTDTLDKIIDVAGKVGQIAGIVVPGYGNVGELGVILIKFFVAQYNAAHADQAVDLPPDAELIRRLEATSTRVVDTGTAFLNRA